MYCIFHEVIWSEEKALPANVQVFQEASNNSVSKSVHYEYGTQLMKVFAVTVKSSLNI